MCDSIDTFADTGNDNPGVDPALSGPASTQPTILAALQPFFGP